MIEVKVKHWRSEYQSQLAHVIERACDGDCDYGIAERAQDTADHVAETLGRLIETLFERKALTLDEVKKIVGSRAGEIIGVSDG